MGQEASNTTAAINIFYLIKALSKYNASDLHLRRDRPPLYRINGKLLPATLPPLSAPDIERILREVIPKKDVETLEKKRQIDFSFELANEGRFRCNVFYTMGFIGASIRRIPLSAPKLEDLRVPSTLKELAEKPRGLLLITGATGSGKSTTVAALINYLNATQRSHIVTIEDPIEFAFKDDKCTITQREMGIDFHTLPEALRACMRQDPDIIIVGEMRDYETVSLAMTAAETGHLVISTLHTNDAKSAIERILDIFPIQQQNQVRVQLAASLVGVLSQQLIPRKDGKGRILAAEVMVKSPSIENCIRNGENEEIPTLMASSEDYYKMQTMNMDLQELVRQGLITKKEALACSSNPDDLKLKMSGFDRKEAYNIQSVDVEPEEY